jgi:hypothetical protein
MRIISLFFVLTMACLVVLSTSDAWASSGTVTVHFKDSQGNYLAGGVIQYYSSGWQTLGTTVAGSSFSGLVTLPGTSTNTDIKIVYLSGSKATTNASVNVTTNPVFYYNTVLVTVKLETCNGVALVGAPKYYLNGWTQFGGGTTPATMELLPYSGLGPGQGNYDFVMDYDGRRSPIKTQDISVDPVVVFKTTKVTLFGSNVLWYNNGWTAFVSPKEVMGGVSNRYLNIAWADFKFDGMSSPTVRLNIQGCDFTAGYLTLKDENGNGLAGGKATPACGGSWQPQLPGQTDANGKLWAVLPSCFTKIKMDVNQSGQEKSKAQLVTDSYTWQTQTATINVNHYDGTGFSGISIDQGGGFWDVNKVTTNGSGVATVPMFAGSGKFKAKWNYTSQEITQAVPSTFVFQTGRVVSACGQTQFAAGSWNPFTSGMEFFPGTYTFKSPVKIGTVVAGTTIDLCLVPKLGADGTVAIPTGFALSQNYPNPFNPVTTITVALPVDATVSLVVYNTLGQKVTELMSGSVSAGYHDVPFDASNLASGLYIYRMLAKTADGKEINKVQRMMLMK